LKAIEAGSDAGAYTRWKKIYGRHFPGAPIVFAEAKSEQAWRDTEEFIEDFYPVDIRSSVTIDCSVYQSQGLPKSLLTMLAKGFGISNNRQLIFEIKEHDVAGSFRVKWKVLNRGPVARKRDCIRGQIEPFNYGENSRKESASFKGDHIVECYILQNDVVIARDSIKVPIL
jgi:hypothetical protein